MYPFKAKFSDLIFHGLNLALKTTVFVFYNLKSHLGAVLCDTALHLIYELVDVIGNIGCYLWIGIKHIDFYRHELGTVELNFVFVLFEKLRTWIIRSRIDVIVVHQIKFGNDTVAYLTRAQNLQ